MEGDLINVMGYDVSAAEVEEGLLQHPAIEEAAVIGVPDAYLGQTIKAFVSLKPGAQATPKEIIVFCKERMPRHQYPRQVDIVEVPPRMKLVSFYINNCACRNQPDYVARHAHLRKTYELARGNHV